MVRQQVSSTSINAVGYDPQTNHLEIEFKNGRVYRYIDVPPDIYDALMHSESHGEYFNANIRDSFKFDRLQ
jgi:hypothetical protein